MDITFEKNLSGTDFTVSTRISSGLQNYMDKYHDGLMNPIIENYLAEQAVCLEIQFQNIIREFKIKKVYSCNRFMSFYSPECFRDISVRIEKTGEIHGRNFQELIYGLLQENCTYISGYAGKSYKLTLTGREDSCSADLITSWELETVSVKNSRTITETETVNITFATGKVIDVKIKNKNIRNDVLEKLPVFMCRFID